MTRLDTTASGFLAGRHAITAFGKGGFRFAGMSHQGSLLIAPSGMRAWQPPSPFLHTTESCEAFLRESAEIDILVIGTGTSMVPLPSEWVFVFRDHRISVDVTATPSAASTYNLLLEEGRRVAAALVAIA